VKLALAIVTRASPSGFPAESTTTPESATVAVDCAAAGATAVESTIGSNRKAAIGTDRKQLSMEALKFKVASSSGRDSADAGVCGPRALHSFGH
jgi:hypothetical protein